MVAVVTKDRIVHWPRCSLKSDVGVEIKVPLKWRCDIALNQTAREGIAFGITGARTGETPDMVTLGRDNDSDFAIPRARIAET